jgi:hypothetical protein
MSPELTDNEIPESTPDEILECKKLLQDKLTAYQIGRALFNGGAHGPFVLRNRGLSGSQIWYCMRHWSDYLTPEEKDRIDSERKTEEGSYVLTQKILRKVFPGELGRKGGRPPGSRLNPEIEQAISETIANHPDWTAENILSHLDRDDVSLSTIERRKRAAKNNPLR